MTIADPSFERDELAEEKASKRSHDLANHVQKLTFDFESVKGGLNTNTAITKEIVQKTDAMVARQTGIIASIDAINAKLESLDMATIKEATAILVSMKGGFKVLSWFGMFAKWIAYIAGALTILYGVFHWGPPK